MFLKELKFIFSIFLLGLVLIVLIPYLSFAQYYPYYNFPFSFGGFGNQNQQNQQLNVNFFEYFVFAPTGSQYAFVYPSNDGLMVSINGEKNYGPFIDILSYGFSNDGNNYSIVGITFNNKYSVIVNGRRYDYLLASSSLQILQKILQTSSQTSSNLEEILRKLMRRP